MPATHKKIALIQMSCAVSTQENLLKAAEFVRQAARAGADVVCLPELFRAQYFCQREEHGLFDTAESIPGPSTGLLAKVCAEEKVVLVASLFERRAPGLYHNTVAVLEADGSLAGKYRKMHIPDDPLYYEKFYFTPGDLGFKKFATSAGNLGVLICWDQWYPEAARITSLLGAETLFYPTAIGWHPSEKEEFGAAQYSAWQTMQRAHAISNGVFVGAVNRVGHEHGDVEHNGVLMKGPEGAGLEFWGGSFIADPFGRVIAQASHDKEEILLAEVDLKLLEDTRRNWPFLRDRRIDAYQPITSRFLD
jgi:N-carbamoylputrescine amidase